MINSFSSLPPMELVMTIMGIVVFLALVFLLVWQVIKNQTYWPILVGFMVPVVLVGFPTIQSIKLSKDTLEIYMSALKVAKNPKDTAAVQTMEAKLGLYMQDAHVQGNPVALTAVANAQLTLGKLNEAALTIEKASQIDPQSEAVQSTATAIGQEVEINKKFMSDVRVLDQQVSNLQKQPNDTSSAATVIQTLSTLQTPTYIDASSALVVAKSYAVLDQHEKSLEVIGNVLQADMNNVAANQLNTVIRDRNLELDKAKLTPFQKTGIQQKLRYAPIVGNKAAIKVN